MRRRHVGPTRHAGVQGGGSVSCAVFFFAFFVLRGMLQKMVTLVQPRKQWLAHQAERERRHQEGAQGNFLKVWRRRTVRGSSSSRLLMGGKHHPRRWPQCHWFRTCPWRLVEGLLNVEPGDGKKPLILDDAGAGSRQEARCLDHALMARFSYILCLF